MQRASARQIRGKADATIGFPRKIGENTELEKFFSNINVRKHICYSHLKSIWTELICLRRAKKACAS